MTDSQNEQTNPYAPVATIEQVGLDHSAGTSVKLVRDFRSQIVSLGVLWIFFGLLALTIVGVLVSGVLGPIEVLNDPVLMIFMIVLGLIATGWLVSGILAVKKNIMGVYIGLGLSYLMVIPNLMTMSLCGIVILIVILLQAHRVIGFAGQMRTLGIPLNQKV